LLQRDTQRYRTSQRAVTARTLSPPAKRAAIRLVKSWSLGLPGVWRAAAVSGNALFAAGIVDGRIVMKRSDLDGHVESFNVPWPHKATPSESPLVLAADPYQSATVGVYSMSQEPLPVVQAFPETDRFVAVAVGSFPGADPALGVARDTQGLIWTLGVESGFTLKAIDDLGTLVATYDVHHRIAGIELTELLFPVPMTAHSRRLYLGLGKHLLAFGKQHHSPQELPSPIRRLACSPPFTLTRIAASLERGAQLVWDGAGQHHDIHFAEWMSEPVLGFNRNGNVIAAVPGRMEVFDNQGGRLSLIGEAGAPNAQPLVIFPMTPANQFGFLTDDGTAGVYEVSI
jgi:hypothetical protein